jgi:hypothetical protein
MLVEKRRESAARSIYIRRMLLRLQQPHIDAFYAPFVI